MVLFDYGQTLIAEQKFDGVKGTEAVLQYATRNKYHLSAEQVQVKANEINREFGRFNPEKRHLFQIEIPNTMFTPYLYESQGIEIALSNSEIDTVFWNAAAPGTPTEGIKDFLEYLKNKGIRTGVISNISYDPSVVTERINRLLPENNFEFVITSSNFIFRKPNKRIFDLALEKAELQPDEVWYIGDQYEYDVKGSLDAGLMPIWYIGAIDLPYTEDKNILTVKTWSEIKQYMEENMEIWDAYDEKLNKINGVSLVRGEPINEGYYHLVSEIIVRHKDGSYLLMQRDERKHLGGMWEASAGGSVLQGEDPVDCAVRELYEETGIVSDALIEIGQVLHYGHKTIYVEYLCNTDVDKDSIILQNGETSAYKWISGSELRLMSREELATQRIQNFIEELQ